MKLLLISVGKERDPLIRSAIDDYLKRSHPLFTVKWTQVRATATRRDSMVAKALENEGKLIVGAIPSGFALWAMDRQGQELSSIQLSQRLSTLRDAGRRGVAIVVGSAHGLGENVLARSDLNLSLSRMTLPHSLATLVLAEQIYRSKTIINNEPYHK